MVLSSKPLLVALLVTASSVATADPFASTDQNPLLGGASLSAPARLLASNLSTADLTLTVSSTAAIQQAGADRLVVDAESREWRLKFEHTFGDRLSARIQLPIRRVSGGSLDSAIERWHNAFGLPNGDRSALPQNQLRINYRKSGVTLLNFTGDSSTSLGDAAIDLGWQLRASDNNATSLWSSVSLPTGNPDKLTGVDAFTGTLVLAHTMSIARVEVFGHVGVRLGPSSGLLDNQRKSSQWLAMLGADFRATGKLTLTMQLDGHGASFDSADLDLLGPAYILTAGGAYAFPSRWKLTFGVAEDVKVEASPDVSIILSVGYPSH